MITSFSPVRLLLALAVSLFFISCSNAPDQPDEIRTSELSPVQLEHLFTITDNPQNGLVFQQNTEVTSDSKGTIFLKDENAHQIHVFSPQGSYIESIGREGSGPGEFKHMINMGIDELDRLRVFDAIQARSTLFAEANSTWEPQHIFMVEGERFGIVSVDEQNNVILRKSLNQMPEPGAYWYKHELTTGNLETGQTRENVLTINDTGNLVSDEGFMTIIPYGRTTVTAATPEGKLYLFWNDSFDLTVYNSKLEAIDSLSVSIPNQPVGNNEINELIGKLNPDMRSLARQHMPETKPVASEMFVDENENIWLKTFDSPEYLVLNPEGEPLGSFDLPREQQMAHTGRNRIYAIETNENGYEVHVYGISL